MLIIIFWILFVFAVLLPSQWAVYLFFFSLSFGSFNTLPTTLNLVPYAVCAPLLVIKLVTRSKDWTKLLDAILNVSRLGWLSVFITVALLVTITAPLLFAGAPTMGLNISVKTGLAFGSGNITQSVYLVTSFFVTLSIYLLMLEEWGRPTFARGALLGGIVAVAAGAIDMATSGSGALSGLRTANYAMIPEAEMAGFHRVIGFDTEASAYGALTLSFGATLYFLRPARLLGWRWTLLEVPLTAALLGFAVLSTSSGALSGLGFLIVLAIIDICVRQFTGHSKLERKRNALDLFGLLFALVAICVVFIVHTSVLSSIWDLIDTAVLQKRSSDSYVERSSWNTISLQGFASTGGYGLGVGSTRASSWPVAVLSCTGILGAAAMIAFIGKSLFATLPHNDATMRRMAVGARLALLVCAVPAAGAGTLVDFGPSNAILFAVMAAIPFVLAPPRWAKKSGHSSQPLRPDLRP